MQLAAARDLKQLIRTTARVDGAVPFATGITRHGTHDYRVAILLRSESDRHLLMAPGVRRIVERERRVIDIEVAGRIHVATAPRSIGRPQQGPLGIGVSVGSVRGGVGSLGFFAARRRDGSIGLVSCNHVIAMADKGQDGDGVVSPSALDGGTNVIASLDGDYPRLTARDGATADCAFAALNDGVDYDAVSVEGGSLTGVAADATPGLEVTKVGRATDARPGVVLKIEVDDVRLALGMRCVVFHDVIVIGSSTPQRFCDPGDSGALVYTAGTFQPVGLLFATSLMGGPHGAGQTWVHPARRVTEALNVEAITR
jgi:hypothetical protein